MTFADPLAPIEAALPPPYNLIAKFGAPIIAGVLVLLFVVAVLGSVFLKGRAAGVKAEQPKVAAAQQQAVAAQQQSAVNTVAADIPAQAERQALDITVHGEELAHGAETAAGASGAVPPDVLRSWALGVDELRHGPAPAAGGAPDPGGADAARAVPPPGPAGQPHGR